MGDTEYPSWTPYVIIQNACHLKSSGTIQDVNDQQAQSETPSRIGAFTADLRVAGWSPESNATVIRQKVEDSGVWSNSAHAYSIDPYYAINQNALAVATRPAQYLTGSMQQSWTEMSIEESKVQAGITYIWDNISWFTVGNYGLLGRWYLDPTTYIYTTAFVPYDLELEQGADVAGVKAVIMFDNSYSGTLSLKIYCADADDAPLPESYAEATSITKTTIYASYSNTISVINGSTIEIDVTEVVQEVTDRPGWVSGNNIMFILEDNGSSSSGTARVKRLYTVS